MTEARRRPLSIALVHYPVLDAKSEVATSTLTTMDVHDLSRSARTYGCEHLYIVHPIAAQRELALKIVEHWTHGSSAKRIPDRKDALAVVRVVTTLAEAVRETGAGTEVWVTAARESAESTESTSLTWGDARSQLMTSNVETPVLVVFGTSWGLAPEVIRNAKALLDPIHGAGDWNHLSVRAACAITLDRLCGPR